MGSPGRCASAHPLNSMSGCAAAVQSKLQEFVSFARGLSEDDEAVMNALAWKLRCTRVAISHALRLRNISLSLLQPAY